MAQEQSSSELGQSTREPHTLALVPSSWGPEPSRMGQEHSWLVPHKPGQG